MSVQTTNFEDTVKTKVLEIKRQLSVVESLVRFEFCIRAEGRLDGEVKISFMLGEYGVDVTGSDVHSVVVEYLRRHGWNERNAPLCLPNVENPNAEDDK